MISMAKANLWWVHKDQHQMRLDLSNFQSPNTTSLGMSQVRRRLSHKSVEVCLKSVINH